MKLLLSEINLIKEILVHTGEKETNEKGEEVKALRRLNGSESSQRRHFIKNTDVVITKIQEEVNPLNETRNARLKEAKEKYEAENSKAEEETDEAYKTRVTEALGKNLELVGLYQDLIAKGKEIDARENEVEMSSSTLDVVKKYFKEWGEEVGFMAGDDEIVSSLEAKLA